jgi:Na+/H+ antiporter NhaA
MLVVSGLKTNSDRLKLTVEIIEVAKKVSRYLPIIVFAYAGLTLVFAIMNILERNIILGIILCLLAGFGLQLTIKIVLMRIRCKRES